MKIYDKTHGITYELNVEDSAHSLRKTLHSKQQEETIKERKVIPFQQSRKTSCPRIINYHAELEITRDVPGTSEDAHEILTLLRRQRGHIPMPPTEGGLQK